MTCHTEEYQCPLCRQCFQCKHIYLERADGWYVKCPTGKWHKAVPAGEMK